MSLIRIVGVEPLDNFRLRLHLTNDTVIERDLRPLLRGQIFDGLLHSPERFRDVHVEGGTVVWGNGADLCPDVLIWGGPPPASSSSVQSPVTTTTS
jgi:Protein of unknown function (DUF2442)